MRLMRGQGVGSDLGGSYKLSARIQSLLPQSIDLTVSVNGLQLNSELYRLTSKYITILFIGLIYLLGT